MDDTGIALTLAVEAGQLLRERRTAILEAAASAQQAKDAADALAQELLARRLTELRSADAVLSEEAPDDLRRLEADRVWIIDPLDGTREYARAGRPDWAVHVALWERGADGLTAAAVAIPDAGLLLGTRPAPVVPAPSAANDVVRIVVSGSRPPAGLERVRRRMPVAIETVGSAGVKAARVITGAADVYLHDSALNEWDAAAPVAVARAAGLHVSSLEGAVLRFNRRIPVTGSLLICRPELADRVRDALT
jgi:3'(2'), 5'-bisphosphate nucleotidase